MAESFSDIGKVEAIDQLYRLSAYHPVPGLTYSAEKGGKVHTAARMYLEGIDFNLIYFPLKHLGYKCVVGVVGELYATLAHPKLLNVILGISSKLDLEQIKELWTGITVAAKEHGFEAVNLDLQPSNNGLFISLAATGETSLLTDKRRMAAKSKDLLCVSGSLGAAYLGMQVLEKGRRDFEKTGRQPDMTSWRMLVGDYLRPELDSSVVSKLEDAEIYPSYGYFVTRGLGDALKRLQRDSGLGAKVYADRLPFEGNTFQLGKQLDIDPVSAAFNGGDDMRLLFTVPILQMEKFRRDFQTFDIIGHLAQPEAGTVLVTPEGVELPVKAQGWREAESL
jgi:thiamine-monophosphate kinase